MGPLPRLIRCAIVSSKINLRKANLCDMLLQTNDHPMAVQSTELERRTQPPGTVAVIKSANCDFVHSEPYSTITSGTKCSSGVCRSP